jgi:hypothetical protein
MDAFDLAEIARAGIRADMPLFDAALLAAIDEIRPERRGSNGRAPYQYQTLLWAIAGATPGSQRLTPYRDTESLKDLVETERRMPVFALHNAVPAWWELEPPPGLSSSELERGHITKYGLRFGLTSDIFSRIVSDEQFKQCAIDYISTYIDELSTFPALLQQLGISTTTRPDGEPKMSINLSALTIDSVLQAIGCCDELGRDEFRKEYDFGGALEYFLLHRGKAYDSKAIAGVAHGYATGDFKESGHFNDGAVIANRLNFGMSQRIGNGPKSLQMEAKRPRSSKNRRGPPDRVLGTRRPSRTSSSSVSAPFSAVRTCSM